MSKLRVNFKTEGIKVATHKDKLSFDKFELRKSDIDVSSLPDSVQLAKIQKSRYYFTDKPCKNKHIGLRLTSTQMCCECMHVMTKARYNKNKVKILKGIKKNNKKVNTAVRKPLRIDNRNKKAVPIPRLDAAKQGLMFYYTGIMCKNGHKTWRNTRNGGCAECLRLITERRNLLRGVVDITNLGSTAFIQRAV